MANPDIISYNSASRQEHAFVKKLMDYLGTKGIEAVADDPNRSEPTVNQMLFGAQWLVLVLTPEAIKSRAVLSLVNTAFDRVRQGHMQGILALAFSSNPVEPEDMPYPSWSTIRTYYVGESNEDHQRTFEKVARTLTASSHVAATSTNNWASGSSYQAPALSRPARRQRVRLIVSILAALIIIIFSVNLLRGILLNNYEGAIKLNVSASVVANTHATSAAAARANAIATANAQGTATAHTHAQGTATFQSQASKMYTQDTMGTPDFSMSGIDKNQHWDDNSTCMFNKDGTYQVINENIGEYTPCMSRKTNFGNFAYQVQMVIKSGDAGGLIFRSDDPITTFYRFSLTEQGEYTLFICQPPDCTSFSTSEGNQLVIANLPVNPNTLVGQPILLTAIAKDKHIYLYINKKLVAQTEDSTTSQGEIGLYAASVSSPKTEVTFSNVQVWNIH